MCLLAALPRLAATHPGHPGVIPKFLTSLLSILGLLQSCSHFGPSAMGGTSTGAGGNSTFDMTSTPSLPGTGSHGVPFTLSHTSAFHLACAVPLRLMLLTLSTPASVPMYISPDLSLTPSHTPSSHRISALFFPTDFGFRYQTHSPNSTVSLWNFLPFTRWYAVFPSAPKRYLLRIPAACCTIQGIAGFPPCIRFPYFVSTASRSVLICPCKMLMWMFTLPNDGDSPTGDSSFTISSDVSLLTACFSFSIAGS